MLPPIQVNPAAQRNRRNRPRPINPLDNPSTTGQLVNPNGSYVANPVPTTAYAGGQGGFGAMLPSVNVGQTFAQQAGSMAGPLLMGGGQTWIQQAAQGVNLPAINTPRPPIIPARPQTYSQLAAQSANQPLGFNQQNAMQQYRQGEQGNVFDVNNPILGQVVKRLANGEAADLTTQDQEALEKFLLKEAGIATPGGGGPGGGGGNSDFMNTRFMQQNLEQGVGYYNQLRWDEQRGKYIQIGQLMREGKLTPQGQWNRKGHKKGRGGHFRAQQAAQQVAPQAAARQQPQAGFTTSYGVVNFNTATG